MRIFGVDPGSASTGYGCIETDGTRHWVMASGALRVPARAAFPDKLHSIHSRLSVLLAQHRPDSVAVEDLFHAKNARSALKVGHVRGVILLAARQAGIRVVEYTPAEVKLAVVGYGRAEKLQVQEMVTLLLGLTAPPSSFDVSDALAVAVCHAHRQDFDDRTGKQPGPPSTTPRSWRNFRTASREADG